MQVEKPEGSPVAPRGFKSLPIQICLQGFRKTFHAIVFDTSLWLSAHAGLNSQADIHPAAEEAVTLR